MEYLYELSNHNKGADWGQVLDDCRRRYNNTFLKLTFKDKEPEIRYIRNFEVDCLDCLSEDAKKRERISYTEIKNLEVVLPTSGYHQTKTGGMFVQKYVKRQYKRSLCEESHSYVCWGNFKLTQLKKNTEIFPYTLEDLDVDSPKVALSKHFAFNGDSGTALLEFDETSIAHINFKLKQIKPIHIELNQEITDFLTRTGMSDKWKLMTTE